MQKTFAPTPSTKRQSQKDRERERERVIHKEQETAKLSQRPLVLAVLENRKKHHKNKVAETRFKCECELSKCISRKLVLYLILIKAKCNKLFSLERKKYGLVTETGNSSDIWRSEL